MASHVNGSLSGWLRRQRIAAVRPYVRGHLLDFGCNTGELAREFAHESYAGIDVEPEALRQAREKFPEHDFYQSEDELSDRRFDTITLLAVIEYVPDRAGLYRRLGKLLAPGGKLVVTTPNPRIGLIRSLGGRIGLFAQDEKHLRRVLPVADEVCADLEQAGLKVVVNKRFLLGLNMLFVAEPGKLHDRAL